jgi:hypothetical protein
MKWWQNLSGIFYQPSKVFEGMKEKPQWLLPLIICALATVLVTVIILKPIVFPEQIARINANPDIPEDAKARAVEQMAGPIPFVIGIVAAAVGQPAAALFIALVFWGTFAMLGGKTKFGGMFAATVWGELISLSSALVKVPLMFIQETTKVHTSLALILPAEMEESFLFRLLAQVDVFALWAAFVMAVGCSVLSGVDKKKSFAVVFSLWGVWVLLAAALGGLFKFGMP